MAVSAGAMVCALRTEAAKFFADFRAFRGWFCFATTEDLTPSKPFYRTIPYSSSSCAFKGHDVAHTGRRSAPKSHAPLASL